MTGCLRLQGFSLGSNGPSVTATFLGPEWIVVVGRVGSGKSDLLKAFLSQKTAETTGSVLHLEERPFRRRTKLVSLLTQGKPAAEVGALTDGLTALGLMDWRDRALEDLPDALQVTAQLLPLWGPKHSILLIDGLLDALDLWSLDKVLDRIDLWRRTGTLVVVSTHRDQLFEHADSHIVMQHREIRFAGRREDLLSMAEPTTLRIVTGHGDAVRELVDPFIIESQPSENGFIVRAPDGQDLAARLLREGYGQVELIELRPPTVRQVLRAFF